jgi:hypothetical protein
MSDEALQALADFLDGDQPPPWEYASELLTTGSSTCISRSRRAGGRALASTRT